MLKKLKIIGLLFMLILFICLAVGLGVKSLQESSSCISETTKYPQIVLLPSPSEFQEQINVVLKQAGKPLIKEDGKPGPETIQGWKDAFCYQSGQEAMRKARMK